MKKKQMEIEWKLQVTDPACWKDIQRYVRSLPEIVGQKEYKMAATYFDTMDLDLQQAKAAYRVRMENDHYVATIKAGGQSTGGVHRRLEFNRNVTGDQPDLEVFAEEEELTELREKVRGQSLVPVVSTRFFRQQVQVMQSGSLVEIALDCGEISSRGNTEPILEVELELLEGEENALSELGEILCAKFPLKLEEKSKFYRGLLLYKQRQC